MARVPRMASPGTKKPPTRADEKFGKTGGRRSAKHHTSGTTGQAKTALNSQFDWAAHTEAVVANIFGEPNEEMSRPPDDVRFGNHGSVSVNYTTGQWYDFENERGGGIKELIRVYKEIDDRDAAIAYAEECQQNFENGEKPRPSGNAKAGQHHQREVEATYSYCDASGQVAFEVVRSVLKQGGDYVTDALRQAHQDLQPAPALRGLPDRELVVGARRRRVHAPGTRKGLDQFQRH